MMICGLSVVVFDFLRHVSVAALGHQCLVRAHPDAGRSEMDGNESVAGRHNVVVENLELHEQRLALPWHKFMARLDEAIWVQC